MVRNKNLFVIAPKAKIVLYSGRMQAIQNFNQEIEEWDRRVDKTTS